MDELDRMYRRLLQNIRGSFPEFLSRPFEVSELYTNLIPYRHNRRELELETIQDYEMTLLRLLSGERGYVIADPTMQQDLRDEAASANPDLSKFRAYATTTVTLAGDGARSTEPPVVRRPGSGAQASVAVPSAAAAAAPTVVPTAGRADLAGRPTLDIKPPETAAPVAAPAAATSPATAPTPMTPSASPPPGGHAHDSADLTTGDCRYCGGELPEGRRLIFCPHCGQNLTVRHCPACGTELEVIWKYCITCGRAMA